MCCYDYNMRMAYEFSEGHGPVHKPFAYHARAPRSFPGGDNAAPQTAVQTADKGCTDVCIKSGASKWKFMNHKGLSLVPRRLVRLTISHNNGSTW